MRTGTGVLTPDVQLMTYVAYRQAQAGFLDDVASVAKTVFTSGKSIVSATTDILEDPALPQVVSYVIELHNLPGKSKPGSLGVPAAAPKKGIGLDNIVKPLGMYVWAEKHKWIYPVGAAAIVGVPFLLGYLFGKKKRR